MKKEYRKLSTLKGWEKNPRTIDKKNFERLKKQITKLGEYKPLLITEDGTVVGGNMRLKAYQDLGWDKAWVSVVEADTEEEKIEYALSDNDRAGQYDGDQMADLIGNFPTVEWNDYAVDIKPPTLVSDIMDQFKEVEEDEAPEVNEGEAESKLGEVYQLGRHRLMCGDSTDAGSVAILMNGQKADMVFTDPPYGMNLDADFSTMIPNKDFGEAKGIKSGKKYRDVIGDKEDFKPELIKCIFTIPAKERFIWGADYIIDLLPNYGKDGTMIVWDKKVTETLDKTYSSGFELCWSEQKHKKDIVRVTWVSVFGTEQEFDHKRYHPTQKPIKLSAWFLNKYSEKNWNIVDLFGGSGSTLIACEQTNRTCYMMELDPHYCDVIRKRYENFVTSQKKSNAK